MTGQSLSIGRDLNPSLLPQGSPYCSFSLPQAQDNIRDPLSVGLKQGGGQDWGVGVSVPFHR